MRNPLFVFIIKLKQVVALTFSFLLVLAPTTLVYALPQGQHGMQGIQGIHTANQTMNVTQSANRAIVNWDAYNIAGGETVNYLHQTGAVNFSVLNRVTGGNIAQIYGTINSAGNVYLINPSGIMIGSSGLINVNSFIASTLDVTDGNFLAGGSLTFKNIDSGEFGSITNLGQIKASGGDIYLIAQDVNNEGLLSAPNGSIAIAAGYQEVMLKDSGEQRLFVRVKRKVEKEEAVVEEEVVAEEEPVVAEAPAEEAEVVVDLDAVEEPDAEVVAEADPEPVVEEAVAEEVVADTYEDVWVSVDEIKSGDLGSAPAEIEGEIETPAEDSVQIKNSGVIEAVRADLIATGGNIYALAINNSGVVRATGVETRDGVVHFVGQNSKVQNEGTVSSVNSTGDGGSINLLGDSVLVKGEIDVSSTDGTGGSISVNATSEYLGYREGVLNASGVDGGDITVASDNWVSLGGTTEADGRQDGGSINVDANELILSDKVSATGESGTGGSVTMRSTKRSWEIDSSSVDVSGASGGKISHVSEGSVFSSGNYIAEGKNGSGGQIDLSGSSVNLLTVGLDASGSDLGGLVRVGGAFQGGKDQIESNSQTVGFVERWGEVDPLKNSNSTFLNDSTSIDVSGSGGTGGTAVIWSEENTKMAASIDATGLIQGGFVEISAKNELQHVGLDNVLIGNGGELLLDPKNIIISNSVSSWTQEVVMGSGYTGGKNVGVTLDASDAFGAGLSMSGDGIRLAVGAYVGDGSGNSTTSSGEVYLFSFTDTCFCGGSLSATVGKGYTGGNNINISTLETTDTFGTSVSLDGDGDRLAIGASNGSGSTNAVNDAGEVYLFSFTDTSFTGGILEATIGSGYTGGKNINVSTLGVQDEFGRSVSLDGDGDCLAIGALQGDGFGNSATDSGEVYLYSFTDTNFSGGTLEAMIGKGYTGGKNINVSTLDNADTFSAVSLDSDGNRLVVGALLGDGSGNAATNSGEAYLFSFTDTSFSGGTLEATIGKGYTGGKNVNLSTLDNEDNFGASVSLDGDGDRFVSGFLGADGSGNSTSGSGEVYLFSFTDTSFSGGTLGGIVGKGYTGGGNVNVSSLEASDSFGWSVALNDNGDRLAVGAVGDDGSGNALTSSGAVYLFSSLTPSTSTFSSFSTESRNLNTVDIENILNSGTAVTLQASNDITLSSAITANNTGGNGGTLTLQAGRSLLINANITTDNGNLNLTANETTANGVIDARRDAGAAVIKMAAKKTITAGTGTVDINLKDGTGKTNATSGDITLGNITAATLNVTNAGPTAGSDILQQTGDALVVTGTTTLSAVGDTITVANTGNDFGILSVTAANATVVDSNAIDMGASTITGSLNITSTAGAITQSGAITANAITSIINAGTNAVTLTNAANDFGTLEITGGIIQATDVDDVIIGTSTVNTSYALTAGGAVTQSVAIAADAKTVTVNAGANAITLTNGANDFGTVLLTGATVAVTDTDDLQIGTTTVTTLAVTAGTTITDTGVITTTGIATFDNSAGTNHAITLDSANTFGGDVTFTTDVASNVTVSDSDAFLIQNGLVVFNLSVTTTGGAVTQGGTIGIGGTTTVVAGNAAITLNDASNDFTGAVSLTNSGGNAISVTDQNAIDIGITSSDGTYTVTAGGAITQSGAVNASTLALSSTGAINLSNVGNQIATLGNVTRGGTLDLFDSAGGLIINGNVGTHASGVTIRTAGDFTMNGSSYIDASGAGNNITLEAAGGRFINNSSALSGAVNPTGGARALIYSYNNDGTHNKGGITGTEQMSVNYGSDPLGAGNAFYYSYVTPVATTGGGTTTTTTTTTTTALPTTTTTTIEVINQIENTTTVTDVILAEDALVFEEPAPTDTTAADTTATDPDPATDASAETTVDSSSSDAGNPIVEEAIDASGEDLVVSSDGTMQVTSNAPEVLSISVNPEVKVELEGVLDMDATIDVPAESAPPLREEEFDGTGEPGDVISLGQLGGSDEPINPPVELEESTGDDVRASLEEALGSNGVLQEKALVEMVEKAIGESNSDSEGIDRESEGLDFGDDEAPAGKSKEKDDNGHGNDEDGVDESNPGKSKLEEREVAPGEVVSVGDNLSQTPPPALNNAVDPVVRADLSVNMEVAPTVDNGPPPALPLPENMPTISVGETIDIGGADKPPSPLTQAKLDKGLSEDSRSDLESASNKPEDKGSSNKNKSVEKSDDKPVTKEKDDNGHGNDADGADESNPGKSKLEEREVARGEVVSVGDNISQAPPPALNNSINPVVRADLSVIMEVTPTVDNGPPPAAALPANLPTINVGQTVNIGGATQPPPPQVQVKLNKGLSQASRGGLAAAAGF